MSDIVTPIPAVVPEVKKRGWTEEQKARARATYARNHPKTAAVPQPEVIHLPLENLNGAKVQDIIQSAAKLGYRVEITLKPFTAK